jgi:methylated-DNA-[protein]-cysteine S-methyltransferase
MIRFMSFLMVFLLKIMKFVIFQTSWGYFGLVGNESAICRTFLPESKAEVVKSHIIREFSQAQFDKNVFRNLQKQIKLYFDGEKIDFNTDIPVLLKGLGEFSKRILTACRNVKAGQIITYAQLAQKAGFPKAGRAAGNTLARNPIPLIIPCHRIIRSDGKLGGFSAPGGTTLKKRLLQHEKEFF